MSVREKQKSSIPIPKRVSLFIKGAQALSTSAGFAIAKKLFFTPQRFPTPERESEYKNSATISRETVNNKKITVYQTGSGKKKVLLTHGWSGRASQFYKIAPALNNAGYRVYSFTAPSHGSSTDKETHMLEFADSIVYLDKNYGPFEALIGHSLGAAASLNAINLGVNTKKVVLLGAPNSIKNIIFDFCSSLGFKPEIAKKLEAYIKEEYGQDIENYSPLGLAPQMTIPALIVHDEKDRDVPIEYARKNHEAWKDSKLFVTKNLGHTRILDNNAVIEEIVSFLNK